MFQKATVRAFDVPRGVPGVPGVPDRDGKGHEPAGVPERDGKGHGLVWARIAVATSPATPASKATLVGYERIER